MIHDRWRATSCPKSPQRHFRQLFGQASACSCGGLRTEWNILGNIGSWGGWLTGYVVPFLFVLTIVVFFHELGHFLVARWCGVRVLVFSVGFGPELFGFNDRHGTRWKVSAIPLGGYVKFFGDENAASVPDADDDQPDERDGAARQLLPQAGRPARRHRRGRTDREFHPRDRDLRGGVHVLRQAGDARARRHRAARAAPPQRPASRPAT